MSFNFQEESSQINKYILWIFYTHFDDVKAQSCRNLEFVLSNVIDLASL